ncbi:MAG: exodeoxyribonuclease VII small subunit [Clostridia bacterium]|nr:exodeoxyribonuclease VII small subunit [Clostridia bacterium]MBQ8793033.1 exodeoxyribonuclease VII small subunit [Clostridia bacterium]
MEKNLSYEQASKELQEIIEKIESSSLSLDDSIKLFERGQELIKICYSCLDGAKGKLTEIKESLGKIEEV